MELLAESEADPQARGGLQLLPGRYAFVLRTPRR
jgi:hypothetical protein